MSFEAFLLQEKSAPKRWRRMTYTASIIFHVALLTVGVVHSFWHVDELTPPVVKVTYMTASAAPPPPPPAAKKRTTPTKIKKPVELTQPKPNQIIQPKDKEEPPEEEDDGVEGGVEGGVAGGVVGGMGDQPTQTATLLPPRVGTGQLISDVINDPRYTPSLPPQLNRAGMVVWGLYKICVSVSGQVTDVKVIKPADPLVEGAWIAKIRTWQYRPYSINGRPVPYCYPMRLEVRSSG
jgi:protein TonB